jgi:hypothetical protein
MKRWLLSAIAIAGLGLMGARDAHAGIQTQVFSHNTNGSDPNDPSTYVEVPWTDSFSVPLFNTHLGTLLSVTIELTIYDQDAPFVFNGSGVTKKFTSITSTTSVTATGPGSTSVSTSGTTSFSNPSGQSVGPHSTYTVANTPVEMGSQTNTLTGTAADPWKYPGHGSMNTSISVGTGSTNITGSGASGLAFGSDPFSMATVKITYTYLAPAVPEPASMGLMGLGMVFAISLKRLRVRMFHS